MESKVALEVAEQEFDSFVDAMRLDVDTSFMDAEDLTAFEKQKRRIVFAIQDGSLFINEEGKAVYTPQHKDSKYHEPLIFNERSGSSVMALDGKKKNYDVAKTYAVMGAMCKVPPVTFAGLVGIDGKICEAIFSLLMD